MKPRKSFLFRLLLPQLFLLLIFQSTTAWSLNFNVPLLSLTNHNTSAYSQYNSNHFLTNFATPLTSDIDTNEPTEDFIPIDATKTDRSLNPVTPGHVSKMNVHTLIPNRPDLRWFAHVVPWFDNVSKSHIHIGLTNNTFQYVTNVLTDLTNRGFDGMVIDWYGIGSGVDGFTLKLKKVLAGNPANRFRYIIMVDKGVNGGDLSIQSLTNQIYYVQTNYFTDPNYETEPPNSSTGNPILMFFGVARLVESEMSTIKSDNEAMGHDTMIWFEQGTKFINDSWEDETFQWTDNYDIGTPPPFSDPFNTNSVVSEYAQIGSSTKKANFAAMCDAFNGTLTRSRGWSDGKYLPSSNGLCMVQRAAAMNKKINANFTRMQWATWTDWEEGTAVEPGIENSVSLSGSVNASGVLSWSINSGEPRTIHHFEIYAATNGTSTAALLVSTLSSNVFQTNISQLGLPAATYSIYVDAVGLPCVRDHMSAAIPFTVGFPEPTGFSAEATNAEVMLSWNADSGATNYVIDYGTDPNNLTSSVSTNGTSTCINITGLLNGTNYFFSIMAQSQTGNSGFTFPAIPATPLDTPVVTGLANSGRIDLSWAPIIGATGYTVSYTLNGVPTSVQTTLNSFSLDGLTDGTQYSFQVMAINVNGQGANGSLSLTPQTFDTTPFSENMQVVLTNYSRTTTLTNFPLLIELSTGISGFDYSQLQPNGTDLVFVDSSGNVLSYDVDQWNPMGTSTIWVRVPQFNSNTVVTAYWGNSTLTSTAPWTTNGSTWGDFLAVYHLEENGLPYADSSLANPLTSGTPPAQSSGLVGNAQVFTTASSQFLTPGSINLGQSFSLSGWVNLNSAAANIQTIWGAKEAGGGSPGVALFVNSFNTSDGQVHLETGDGGAAADSALSAGGAVPVNGWHQVFATVDEADGVAQVYVDGFDNSTANTIFTDFPNTNQIDLGALLPGNGNQFFLDGTVDEARIEPFRSADWVWASWMTVVSNSILAGYGAVTPLVHLGAPTVTAQATNGSVTLNWNSISGAAGYDILMSNNATGFNLLTTVGAPSTSVQVSLANGVLYFFEVAATNSSGGVGPDSAPVSAEPLDTPTGFTAFGTNRAVDLNWIGVTGANGYIVTYGTVQGQEQTAVAASGQSSTTVSGLNDGTQYFFLVKATNANGQGSNAGEPNATPIGTPSIQTAAAGDGSVNLSWTSVPGALGYVILYVNGGTLTAQPSGSTSATINNLSDGTQYSFVVEGTNANGTSTPSSSVSATPVAAPAISSAFGTNAAVVLNWSSAAGASGYIISYGTAPGQESLSVAAPQSPFSVTGLTPGLPYFFVVQATNSNNGQSPNSNETNATPIATPANVTSQALNASVSLAWSSSAGASSYWVLYGTTSHGPYPNVLAVNTTTATVNNLINGTHYFFIVEGTNATGVSAPSIEVPVTPTAPQTLIPTDYSRSMKITFTGYNRPGPVANFPVLVKLSTSIPGFAYNQFMSTNGNDLRFTDSSGNLLNHEIDQWNTNGVSTVWVSTPSIASRSDFITAYWGDRANSNTPAFTTNGATWPGFLSVMHLKENGFPYADSTTQHPATTGTAPTVTTSGEIGSAESFNGTSQFLAPSGAVNLGSAFSLSAWVNLNVGETNIQTIWANKSAGGSSNGIALFVNTFNTADGAVLLETSDGNPPSPVTAISTAHVVHTNGWHHIFAAVNEAVGTAALYVDGTNVTALNSNSIVTDFANNTNMTLGSFTNNHWFLNGSMDEARIEPLRDSNWVWATVMTAASNSFFESNGPITLTKVLDQDAFSDSMKLTISGYTGSTTLSNFPLLINLSTSIPGFAYSQFASATGNDLRFTDASGQILLAHEIDTWNTSGTSSVWVSVPIVASNTNYIIAYWGNPNLTGVASFTTNGSTWSNYLAVFHLRESTFPYLDSTTNHNANSGTPPTQTTSGEIGNAEAFNGSTTFLNAAGAINLGNSFSFSAWVNLSNSASNIQTIWANKGGGANSNGIALFVNSFNTADGQVHVESGDGVNPGARADSNPGTVTVGAWHHVFAAIDRTGGTATIYVDGINVTSNAFDSVRTDFGNNAPFTLARYTNSNFYLKGMIDEARIEPLRNADWVKATYQNITANSSFVGYPTPSNPVGAPNILIRPSQPPRLQIGVGGNGLQLSWAQQTTTFMLYSSTDLMNWDPVSNYTVLPNGQVQVPMSSAPGATFYRLQSQ